MSGEPEPVLRSSLDAIDRIRRRVFLAGLVAVAGTFAAYLWLDHVARTSDNLEKLIMASVLALTCVIAWSTFALAILLVRMTRSLLRAIDLAGRG